MRASQHLGRLGRTVDEQHQDRSKDMSTAEQTGRSPLTASEKEKVLNDTAALIQRALSAGRMLHMTARNSGLHEVEIALGMQLATNHILGGNSAYAGLFIWLLEAAYIIGPPA